jgi:1-deoxy-D-xylulose-5-phosphate synthase
LSILENVTSGADLRALSSSELLSLRAELREYLIDTVSKTGGHLASNLGAVELTLAIHRVFDTSRDRLVLDVGHQCYVHKLLTGRSGVFDTLRSLGGVSGFPRPSESVHDASISGHASGSISVALGMARARTITGADYSVIAVLGDGALTGGLAYEGLSDAGESGEGLIVVLNDNGMSITKSVGGVARYLSRQRMKPSYLRFKKFYCKLTNKIPGGRRLYALTHALKSAIKQALLHCSMFEEMGFSYIGPLDGHDIGQIEAALNWAKQLDAPAVVHVITQKGRGYPFAEQNPGEYHGVPPFDRETGIVPSCKAGFSSVFGETLTELAREDSRVCAIVAAMASGTGLEGFAREYPNRFFDVGIAEGHAVAMAAGLAKQGMTPVVAVYSTFLQRAYDMILHDVAIDALHVVLCVDRAGLVAGDGETHQGVYDVSYLTSAPGMTVYCPASFGELRDMLRRAVTDTPGSVAVRYPKSCEGEYTDGGAEPVKTVREGADITLVTYGTLVNTAIDAARELDGRGVSVEIIKLGVICPLDLAAIERSIQRTRALYVLEECVSSGCVGEKILSRLYGGGNVTARLKNVGDRLIPCGSDAQLRQLLGLDAQSVARDIMEVVNEKNAT